MNAYKSIKKYLKTLEKVLFYSMMDIVWLISGLVPKDKNLWVFGSWFGNRLPDNLECFSELYYLIKQDILYIC